MNKYEITIITAEDLKDTPVKKEIEALAGKILTVNPIGQRQLSYKIKGQQAGFFTSILFEIESTKVFELVNKLNLKTDILRSLIITAPPAKMVAPKEKKDTAKTELEIAPEILPAPVAKVKPETIAEAIQDVKAIDETLVKKETEKEPEVKVAKPKKEKPKEEPKESLDEARDKESKISSEIAAEELSSEDRLKALDKKLDELLKE